MTLDVARSSPGDAAHLTPLFCVPASIARFRALICDLCDLDSTKIR